MNNERISGAQYLALSDTSVCKVQLHKTGGALIGVTIEFAGDLANLPSKSNDKMILWKQRRIMNSPKSQAKVALMTNAYTTALMDMGELAPTFHDAAVHVTALLSSRMKRQDSHNACKVVGDWLEKIGLIDNDKHAQIFAMRRSDYSGLSKESDSTCITVQLLSAVQNVIESAVLECRRRMG